jgi:lathosterol oxidase
MPKKATLLQKNFHKTQLSYLYTMTWDFYFKSFNLIGGRYFMFATIAFVIFYILFRRKFFYKKIQAKFPKNTDVLREMAYSVLTIAIFSLFH